MDINEKVMNVCNEVVKQFSPEKVILFNIKHSMDGEVRGFKICVIIETANRLDVEKHIYLDIESEVPFDVLVYTPQEWVKLLDEKSSFACQINGEGTFIYGQPTP